MGFSKQILPPCPNCGKPALCVLSTRKTSASTRRRKQCDACGYRITTHEITSDAFELAQANASLLNRFRKLLGDDVPEPAVSLCETCKFNEGDACNFDIPEYQTTESSDCNLHDPI